MARQVLRDFGDHAIGRAVWIMLAQPAQRARRRDDDDVVAVDPAVIAQKAGDFGNEAVLRLFVKIGFLHCAASRSHAGMAASGTVGPKLAVRRDVLRLLLDHLPRSEEHTSELQSLMRNSYAVFCL